MENSTKQHSNVPASERESKCLWVGFPVDQLVSEGELKQTFENIGDVDRIRYFPDRNYAFVQYKRVEDAVCARNQLSHHVFSNNATVRINFSNTTINDTRREHNQAGPPPQQQQQQQRKRPREEAWRGPVPPRGEFRGDPLGDRPGEPRGWVPEDDRGPKPIQPLWQGELTKLHRPFLPRMLLAPLEGRPPPIDLSFPPLLNVSARMSMDRVGELVFDESAHFLLLVLALDSDSERLYREFGEVVTQLQRTYSCAVCRLPNSNDSLILVPPSDLAADIIRGRPPPEALLAVLLIDPRRPPHDRPPAEWGQEAAQEERWRGPQPDTQYNPHPSYDLGDTEERWRGPQPNAQYDPQPSYDRGDTGSHQPLPLSRSDEPPPSGAAFSNFGSSPPVAPSQPPAPYPPPYQQQPPPQPSSSTPSYPPPLHYNASPQPPPSTTPSYPPQPLYNSSPQPPSTASNTSPYQPQPPYNPSPQPQQPQYAPQPPQPPQPTSYQPPPQQHPTFEAGGGGGGGGGVPNDTVLKNTLLLAMQILQQGRS